MAHGFIRGPLDIKLLLLYIMARMAFPVEEAQLLDIALCDDGVDYFGYIDALNSLKSTKHLAENEEGLLYITDKGRANGSICEDEVAYSVRLRCDRSVAALNKELMRRNQIRAKVTSHDDGSVTVRMVLDDDSGNLMTLDMLAPDQLQGERLAKAFKADAAGLYDLILTQLLQEEKI